LSFSLCGSPLLDELNIAHVANNSRRAFSCAKLKLAVVAVVRASGFSNAVFYSGDCRSHGYALQPFGF